MADVIQELQCAKQKYPEIEAARITITTMPIQGQKSDLVNPNLKFA